MPKTAHASETEQLAAHLRQIHGAFHETAGEGATQQVMSGFADAYRAWLEAVSAKPQTMLDLQGRYMQEQMKLWMQAMQPAGKPNGEKAPDKRFAAPEWDELPMFPTSATRISSPRR
jgi:hypothetical protein